MTFNRFDTVQLLEDVPLDVDVVATAGSLGAVVEILNPGEAYLVECFGGWVSDDAEGNLAPAQQDDAAFRETLGVGTLHPSQMRLVTPAEEAIGLRAQLLMLVEEMPEDLLAQVKDFAEFIQHKSHEATQTTSTPD
ncbi:MAG: hypothetical protein AAF289_21160 [Cyanobacteria bacterium P01_A01_bin.135]